MAAMNGSSSSGGGVSPSELAAMLRKSADVVEKKEFHPILYQTMRALTAYAGEYADGGISASAAAAAPTSAAPAAASTAPTQKHKSRRKDAARSEKDSHGDPPGKKKSAFADVPDDILDSKPKSKRGSRTSSPSKGGAAAAAERVGAPGGQFSSAASAAGSKGEGSHPTPGSRAHKGLFGLKGLKKGIEKIGDVFEHSKEDVPFDEYAWCDEHFTRGCACKSRKNQANANSDDKQNGPTEASSGQQQQQQTSSTSSSTAVNDPDKPAKPCFQRPINPSSNLIANGWIDQQRRSKMRVVWKDVLASLVEGRRPGEETTLWIQRQVINQQTGKVTGLEALHQIPMKWLEDVNYVDLYGDHRFTLKVYNIAEEFYFRTRDEQSAQSWVLTLRSARDASLEGVNRMNAGGASGNDSAAAEKAKPSAKDMGLHDLDDWDSKTQAQEGGGDATVSGSSPQAGTEGNGERRPSSAGSQPQQPQQQQPQPTPVRMKVSELRAIAHGAGYDTRGMERQDLERIAAYVRSGQFNPQKAGASTAASASDANQDRSQETAAREAEQREKEQAQSAAQEEAARRQKEVDERLAAEKMRREKEAAEQKRMEEQMAAAAAEQQRRNQEFEAQAAEIKRKQEAERQRKMAEFARQQQQQQQQQAQAAAEAERKKREEEQRRMQQQRQQAEEEARRRQQQQQARAPGHIPTPPNSGGYPQTWGQQQQHYPQWQQQQQQQQRQQQQQQPHFQQQGFPGQQPHPHQFFNQNMPQQGYQQHQQQQAHFQQQQQQQQQQQRQQQQQQRPQQQPQPQQQQPQPGAAFANSKYMEEKDEEEQSAMSLQIKRAILINWALQPPNLNALRPIDQLITTIHTAMPPAFGVASHAYFSKFTPILQHELVASTAMGNRPDETKLKKAVRKVRVFLHPDKLPRDLSSDQQFTARMLWDITSDSWEEFEKHKDELDWLG